VVLGGVIAYANSVKEQELLVSPEELEQHGAVSEPVAVQMARGVRGMTGATIGVAITGIAGPEGGTPDKPVGTVWIAVDVRGAVTTNRAIYIGDRVEIRHRATQAALDIIRRALLAQTGA
jgi:nicotinamide-nucleotide amidase